MNDKLKPTAEISMFSDDIVEADPAPPGVPASDLPGMWLEIVTDIPTGVYVCAEYDAGGWRVYFTSENGAVGLLKTPDAPNNDSEDC